jgi:hypothetical protein
LFIFDIYTARMFMATKAAVFEEVLQVFQDLAKELDRDVTVISSTRLFEDLRFTKPQRRLAAVPLSEITIKYAGKKVLKQEAEEFSKVEDAQNLCWKLIP